MPGVYVIMGLGWICLGIAIWVISFTAPMDGIGHGVGVLNAKGGQALVGGGIGLVMDAVARPDTKPNMVAVSIMALAFTGAFGA